MCMLCCHQVSGTSILTDSEAVLKVYSVSECDRMRMLRCTCGHSHCQGLEYQPPSHSIILLVHRHNWGPASTCHFHLSAASLVHQLAVLLPQQLLNTAWSAVHSMACA